MATGISKREQFSDNALTAINQIGSLPLPKDEEIVELAYVGKSPESVVLERPNIELSEVIKNRKPVSIDRIPDSTFVLADNFIGLHNLYGNNEKVTLFYLDPPYGTGMDFQSRRLEHAYNDKMGQAAYIEFMRRRLILMRECMTDDGSIYVHIGHQMLAHFKVLMDEVFGTRNFRNVISRRKCSSKNFTTKQYANLNDYVLFYTKSSKYKWNQPTQEPEKGWIEREYNKIDQFGRRHKLVPVHAPGTRNGATGCEWKGKMPPPGKHWQYTPEKLDELDRNGDIYWSKNGNPRRKVYWTKDKKIALTDYWSMYRDAYHQSIKITGYPTEKNFDMLKMIITASSAPGDLVVDPFCGSGTTLHAARDLGRRWIGFDSSFTAAKTTMHRMKYGTEAMGDYRSRKKTAKPKPLDISNQESPVSSELHFVIESWLWDSFKSEIKSFANR